MKAITILKSSVLVFLLIMTIGFDIYEYSFAKTAELSFKHDCHQVYRANVKLMEDEDVANVNLEPSIHYKKISDLQDIEYFYPKFGNNRYAEEFETVKFKCHIREYKEENGSKGDNDYHVVLEDIDNPNITMVAEIPDPTCPKVKKSKFVKYFRHARKIIDDNTTEVHNGKWYKVRNQVYTIYGVLFRDSQHGTQESQLPNFIEIHPVLSIEIK